VRTEQHSGQYGDEGEKNRQEEEDADKRPVGNHLTFFREEVAGMVAGVKGKVKAVRAYSDGIVDIMCCRCVSFRTLVMFQGEESVTQ
jgi:hypothetical protein